MESILFEAAGREVRALSAKEYLDTFEVEFYLHDAISCILAQRLDRPLEFLAHYFSDISRGTCVYGREFVFVCGTIRNRLAFWTLFGEMFVESNGERKCTPDEIWSLLRLLCPDHPRGIVEWIFCAESMRYDDENASLSLHRFCELLCMFLLHFDFFLILFQRFYSTGLGSDASNPISLMRNIQSVLHDVKRDIDMSREGRNHLKSFYPSVIRSIFDGTAIQDPFTESILAGSSMSMTNFLNELYSRWDRTEWPFPTDRFVKEVKKAMVEGAPAKVKTLTSKGSGGSGIGGGIGIGSGTGGGSNGGGGSGGHISPVDTVSSKTRKKKKRESKKNPQNSPES
eukprot:TRINITY_DN1993_c0_g3_i1.p1 TRINITY_DN1993_c0_g3~~TRINITY_DN1993_c0_g3_i1.p1  ORF type:complete len:341 (-),score=86.14 TRINITY_DN1993_c0_g3_i1:40-1062(-)